MHKEKGIMSPIRHHPDSRTSRFCSIFSFLKICKGNCKCHAISPYAMRPPQSAEGKVPMTTTDRTCRRAIPEHSWAICPAPSCGSIRRGLPEGPDVPGPTAGGLRSWPRGRASPFHCQALPPAQSSAQVPRLRLSPQQLACWSRWLSPACGEEPLCPGVRDEGCARRVRKDPATNPGSLALRQRPEGKDNSGRNYSVISLVLQKSCV